MLRLAAGFPDALVGLAPDLGRALGLGLDDRPEPPRQALAVAAVEQDRVQRRAEDVVLALVEGAVADPDRTGARVAGELVPGRLGQIAPAVDPVHDLERAVLGRLDVGDELHVLVGLPVQVEPVQRLERERAVADPGVAVVPVALAPRGLGERRRQRRHRGAGRHVGQALDRQCGALDRVAPAVVRDPRPLQPGAPEARGRRQLLLGLVDVLRRGQLLGPREAAVGAVAGLEHAPRTDAVALDAERQVGLEPDRQPGATGVGCVAAAVHERPLRGSAAVVEDGLTDELDLDAALETFHRAHEDVLCVVVGRRPRVRRDRVLGLAGPHRQRLADDDPAVRRLPGRLEDVRARDIGACSRVVDPERSEAEETGLAVEQAPEHALRVEARHAQPVDRTVLSDERSGVAVREERVVRDRRERRRRRRALRAGLGLFALTAVTPSPTGRTSGRARPATCSPLPGPTTPARRRAPAAERRRSAA